MKLFSKHEWSKRFTGFMAERGWLKAPGGILSAFMGGLTGWTNLGSAEKQMAAYRGNVYKCVTLIYRRATAVPFHLYREAGDTQKEIERHPFLDLMWKPNPFMTGSDLKGTTFMQRDLTGKAFWYVPRNRLNRPAEIWPLNPANFVRLLTNTEGTELLGYEFRTDAGRPVPYAADEIVYFRYPHPRHFMEAASPIQALAYEYDIDLAIKVYERAFFQNSARPDVVLETDQALQKPDAQRLLLSWNEAHQGADKRWNTAIMSHGLKAHVLNVSAADMEFAALAKLTKQDIMEAYNVPPGKLGTVEDVNRANAIGVDITFNSESIMPRLTSYDERVSLSVVSLYDPGLWVEHENCVPRDQEYELKERELNLRMLVTTVNEEREEMGLKPVPWGTVPWVSIAQFEYGNEPAIIQEPGQEGQRSEVRGQRSEEDKRPGAANIRLMHERQVAARSRQYRTYLRKFFKGQEARVQENLAAFFPRIEGAVAGMSIRKTREWMKQNQGLFDRINFRLDQADKDLTDGAKPFLQAALQFAGDAALTQVGSVDVIFDLTNPRVMQYLGEQTARIRDINRTTHAAIDQALKEGFEAGESMQEIAGRIGEVFDQADKTRSLRIAQTQVNGASNAGTLEGYEQSGAVGKKEWIAGPGARASHQAAAARYKGSGAIPLDADFEVGDGKGPCPGRIGRPEEDINCRCTILPVLAKR